MGNHRLRRIATTTQRGPHGRISRLTQPATLCTATRWPTPVRVAKSCRREKASLLLHDLLRSLWSSSITRGSLKPTLVWPCLLLTKQEALRIAGLLRDLRQLGRCLSCWEQSSVCCPLLGQDVYTHLFFRQLLSCGEVSASETIMK
eukprot:scaffold1696_cov258-Pinguiococcus_pyrenoidosus.AAC.14